MDLWTKLKNNKEKEKEKERQGVAAAPAKQVGQMSLFSMKGVSSVKKPKRAIESDSDG
jgi:hypothetical protein